MLVTKTLIADAETDAKAQRQMMILIIFLRHTYSISEASLQNTTNGFSLLLSSLQMIDEDQWISFKQNTP